MDNEKFYVSKETTVREAVMAAAVAAEASNKRVYVAGKWDWLTGPAINITIPWPLESEDGPDEEENILWMRGNALVPYREEAYFIVM